MTSTRIHVMRHGEVDNPEGVLYGRLPGFGLTGLGHEMVRLSAEHLVSSGADIARGSLRLWSRACGSLPEQSGKAW